MNKWDLLLSIRGYSIVRKYVNILNLMTRLRRKIIKISRNSEKEFSATQHLLQKNQNKIK